MSIAVSIAESLAMIVSALSRRIEEAGIAAPPAPVPARRGASVPNLAFSAASVAAMLLAWWAFSAGGAVSRDLLPSPGDV